MQHSCHGTASALESAPIGRSAWERIDMSSLAGRARSARESLSATAKLLLIVWARAGLHLGAVAAIGEPHIADDISRRDDTTEKTAPHGAQPQSQAGGPTRAARAAAPTVARGGVVAPEDRRLISSPTSGAPPHPYRPDHSSSDAAFDNRNPAVSDLDIARAARQWIAQHEGDAMTKARQMVEQMRREGDDDGADKWLRIVIAIGSLGAPPTHS
jgi:hypothetical protein